MGVNGCSIGCMLRSDTLQITPEILSLIARIDEFKGAWRALGTLAPERLSALRRVATIESIGSSTRIEGSKLTDREVERLLSNLAIQSFDTRDEQEVAGYAELMDLVFSSWQDIPFNENHIQQLHQILLRHSEKDVWHRGNYKTNSNSVAAFDENGTQIGIVFETASPFDTPRLMSELVAWVAMEREKAQLHPLLIIAIFVVVFLEIHPFQDGNGRLSRVLTTLLLIQAGYTYVPYSSLESVIELNKEAYYLALRQTQGTIRTVAPNWQPWLVFFLRSLAEQVRRLEKKVEREKAVLHPLLIIGIFVVVFLENHPFQDGNGRLSRVLTTLLLLQAGYAYVPYSSLESVIEASKEGYYLALRQTQGTIRSDAPNWQPWLLFFLRSLAEQVRRLEKKVEREKIVLAALPELSLQIVEFAREHGRVTMAEAIKLTGVSRNTLKQHFRDLTERNHLEQHGSGRGVWYGLK